MRKDARRLDKSADKEKGQDDPGARVHNTSARREPERGRGEEGRGYGPADDPNLSPVRGHGRKFN